MGERFTIISADLATKTGLAFWSPGMEKPRSILLELPSGEEWNGRAYRKLYEALWAIHQIAGDVAPITKVYFEAPISPGHMQGFTNAKTIYRLVGLVAVLEMFADVIGANCMFVYATSWKRNFFGAGIGMKRAEAKKASMARCRELGWFPEDDNCADALGILNYALTVHEAIEVPWADKLVPRATSAGIGHNSGGLV